MMTESPFLEIKVQGCWAVRNLAYEADFRLKGQIMEVRPHGLWPLSGYMPLKYLFVLPLRSIAPFYFPLNGDL